MYGCFVDNFKAGIFGLAEANLADLENTTNKDQAFRKVKFQVMEVHGRNYSQPPVHHLETTLVSPTIQPSVDWYSLVVVNTTGPIMETISMTPGSGPGQIGNHSIHKTHQVPVPSTLPKIPEADCFYMAAQVERMNVACNPIPLFSPMENGLR